MPVSRVDELEMSVFPTDKNDIPMSWDFCLESFQLFIAFIRLNLIRDTAIEAKYESGDMCWIQDVIIPIA